MFNLRYRREVKLVLRDCWICFLVKVLKSPSDECHFMSIQAIPYLTMRSSYTSVAVRTILVWLDTMLEVVKERQAQGIQGKSNTPHNEYQHWLPHLFEEDKALYRLDEDAEAQRCQGDNIDESSNDMGSCPAIRKPLGVSRPLSKLVGNVCDDVAPKVGEVVESVRCQCERVCVDTNSNLDYEEGCRGEDDEQESPRPGVFRVHTGCVALVQAANLVVCSQRVDGKPKWSADGVRVLQSKLDVWEG